VVSNAKSRELNTTLEILGLRAFFELVLSRDDVFPNKPDPTPYRLAAEKLGVPPAHGLAVEDSPTGLSAALLSGLPSVGIAHFFTPLQLHNPLPNHPELCPLRIETSMVNFFAFLKTLSSTSP
jgi:beta-phosphoglucomutase-like phosphatase (HAD superfamily)